MADSALTIRNTRAAYVLYLGLHAAIERNRVAFVMDDKGGGVTEFESAIICLFVCLDLRPNGRLLSLFLLHRSYA